MSLTNDLADVAAGRSLYPGPTCTVYKILAQLDATEREQLIRLIDNPNIPGASIAGALTKNGYPVADKTVLRHRKRGTASGCRCPQDTP